MIINKAKTKKNYLKSLLGNIILENFYKSAYAVEGNAGEEPASTTNGQQEGAVSNNQNVQANTQNTQGSKGEQPIELEKLIAQVRGEEKAKLYPELEKLKTDVKEKTTKINNLLLRLGSKDEEINNLKKQLDEYKNDAKGVVSKEVEEIKKENAKLKQDLKIAKDEITSKTLEFYKKQKIQEAEGKLVEELVGGTTTEEIDESIEKAKEVYNKIISSQVASSKTASSPAKVAGSGIFNPTTESITRKFNVTDLNKLNLNNPEDRKKYEEMRKQLGL